MLNLMGMGLRGILSLTLQEDDVLKKTDRIYFETYTSIAPGDTVKELENRYDRPVTPVGRDDIENPKRILEESLTENVSLIVVGDPMMATTHSELRFEAENSGVSVKCYENASIITAAFGCTGLFTYRISAPVSLPFPSEKFFPRSVYDKITKNVEFKKHTLILLDLQHGKGMKVSEAIDYLLKMERSFGAGTIKESTDVIAISDLGHPDEKTVKGSVDEMRSYEGGKINCLILPESPTEDETRFMNLFCGKRFH
ncbi:MAG: diphthine synthase [Thermoplasmataceae archaeon]